MPRDIVPKFLLIGFLPINNNDYFGYRISNTIVYNNFPWPWSVKSRFNTEFNAEFHTEKSRFFTPEGDARGNVKSRFNTPMGDADGNEKSRFFAPEKIAAAAQLILDERQAEEDRCAKQGQTCSLATLYAAGNMPQGLVKAHAALDKAVDAAYGYKPVTGKAEGDEPTDAARVAFLFALYQTYLE